MVDRRARDAARHESAYTPVLPTSYWAAIKLFVTDAVESAAPEVSYTAKQLYAVTACLVLRAWQTASLPLEVDDIFAPAVVDRVTAVGLPQYTKSGGNTMRARLRRVCQALPGSDREPDRHRSMGRSDPSTSYGEAELAAPLSWAAAQPPEERHSSAMTLLSLSLGRGVSSREIAHLRIGDIAADGREVVVVVRRERSRRVPAPREWDEALVERVAGRRPDDWASRVGQEGGNRNLASDTVSRTRGGFGPQARRKHAT